MADLKDASRNPRELKRLVAALQRQSQRLPTLEQQATANREAASALQAQVKQQQRTLTGSTRLIGETEKALRAILAIEHGKRTDRRLARAQRLAQRALTQVERWHETQPAGEVQPAGRRRRTPPATRRRRAAG